jgi:integrase
VLTTKEVTALLSQLNGVYYLMAAMLYGSGLRRIELVLLRVKDIDFDYRQVRMISGKGRKHRLVTLAVRLLPLLGHQAGQVKNNLRQDLMCEGCAAVWLPDALV